jgi:uncharacterized protein
MPPGEVLDVGAVGGGGQTQTSRADVARRHPARKRFLGGVRAAAVACYSRSVTLEDAALLAASGIGAGVVNAIAGGGTLLTFPALLAVGLPPVTANATNTLALWPGQFASVWAYRRHLGEERGRAVTLAVPSLVGGLAGALLLVKLPESTFEAVVPWLILFACAVLALQDPIRRLAARAPFGSHPAVLWVAQLLISVYGGYFGAGIGILMLAAMGILLSSSLQHANALKVLFSLLINGVAAIYFLGAGRTSLPEAALVAAAGMIGGFAGAHLAQRLPPKGMRLFAIGVGLFAAGKLMLS